MSLKPSNAGVYQINALNVDTLWVKGVPFEQYITELVAGDQFEQGEIDELKLLVQYLNTSGLSSEWIIDNNNKNQDLKTAITALQTKLANIDTTALTQSSVLTDANRNSVLKTAVDGLVTKLTNIDTTALTQSSVLTDDNRNSVLKTRIDGNDGSLSTLTDKTRYILISSVGNNSANPKTANTFLLSTNNNPSGIHKGDIELLAGLGQIRIKNDTTTIGANNYTDNQINLQFPGGMISSDARLNRMMGSDKIEIGQLGAQSSAAINVGGKGAQINIGSSDTPEIGQTNTIITIGKRTLTRNTETYLQGNIYTNEARWENLTVTTGITLANIISLLSGSAPSYILGAFLTNAGGFNYSDILHMNLSSPLQKNKDIATATGIVLDSLKIFDTSVVNVFPKISTYFANGDIVSTQVVGQNITSVFSGQIKLENHNTLNPLDINWAFSQDDEKVNVVDIKGNDGIFIHQGASSNGQPLRIMNSCNGGIELKIGGTSSPDFRGRKEHALGGLFLRRAQQLCCAIVKADPDESFLSFKRKTNNPTAVVDYRLLVSVDADISTQQNHGIVVYSEAKHKVIDDAAIANSTSPVYLEYTAIDEDNITTPSMTFLGNYTGPTTKTLYTNANSDLMYDGQPVAVGSIAASGGGLNYVISAPNSTTITTPSFIPTTNLTMSETYTSAPLRTATLSVYAANTNYHLVSISGAIPKAANPILSGVYELNQYVNLTANANHTYLLYAKLYFNALPDGPLNLINKTYTSPAGSGATNVLFTEFVPVPNNDLRIIFDGVVFPTITVNGGGANSTLELAVVKQDGTVIYTFATLSATNGGAFQRVFPAPSPAPLTITASNLTAFRFRLTNLNPTSPVLEQASARDAISASYYLPSSSVGSSIRMLLHDGTSNPTTLAHNTAAIYALSIPLPATPFVITEFTNPNLTLEEWFIQPTGNTNNHTVALQFNNGGLSHLHTSIASISSVPSLSSVMAVGNSVGTNALNMNNQNITSCATITATTVTPTNITGWNVKSLTAGSGITAVDNNGTWTITNTGIALTPTLSQVLTAGNAAGSQSITGINAITATTVNATNIPNWNVKQLTGAGLAVVTNNGAGTYTVTVDETGESGHLAANSDFSITAATAVVSRKPTWYGLTWLRRPEMSAVNLTAREVYMSSNGKIVVVAIKHSSDASPQAVLYSNDFSVTYSAGNTTKNWTSVTGNTTGDLIYAIQGAIIGGSTGYPREIWRSTNRGSIWSQQPSPPDVANAIIRYMRVSGDAKFQIINDNRAGSLGKIYKSSDYGATWTSQNITTATSTVGDMAMSATGQVQFVEISGTSDGTTATQNNGGVYRSLDYGASWARVNTTDPLYRIACDATGRIVIASTDTGVITSRNYGESWTVISLTGANALGVSANGNLIWVGCIYQSTSTQLYYSDDHGQTFSVRGQTGSYITTNYLAIATNNDGTIVVGGGETNLNQYRQAPSEVVSVSAGSGLSLATTLEGVYSLSLAKSPFATYFANINVSATGFTPLPTNLNLALYDYVMDFSITGLASNQWLWLRFQDDSGASLVAWDSCLVFNNAAGGTIAPINIAEALYTNAGSGNSIWWLNGGSHAIAGQVTHVKASYKISAVGPDTFIVSLEQCQPVSILPATNNTSPYYKVFATQIKYRYNNLDSTRWAPANIGFFSNIGTPFTNLNCCIRQCIKSTVAIIH
jgi:hypothetical protein